MKQQQTITFLVPESLSEEERKWLASLPELQLLGSLRFLQIPWKDEQIGAEEDWSFIANQLEQEMQTSYGFVIWAPEQSLLSLSAFLDISFSRLSVPIVLFSAPSPTMIGPKKLQKLGLQSVLINAMYLAQSDIAEVMVLSHASVWRPQQCFWRIEEGRKEVFSTEQPLAQIHFQLDILQETRKRSSMQTHIHKVSKLTDQIDFLQWYPNLSLDAVMASNKIKMIQTMDAYWDYSPLQHIRKQLLDQNIPIIWYSQQNWSKRSHEKGEYFFSHPQEWWASLLAQFAFTAEKDHKKAFHFIEKKLYEDFS